jgi:hypothetical protein
VNPFADLNDRTALAISQAFRRFQPDVTVGVRFVKVKPQTGLCVFRQRAGTFGLARVRLTDPDNVAPTLSQSEFLEKTVHAVVLGPE